MDYGTILKTAKSLSRDLFPDRQDKYREMIADSLNLNNFIDANREKYKYTPLDDFFGGEYAFPSADTFDAKNIADFLPDIDAVKIFTVNGICREPEIRSESGFVYGSLTAALKSAEYGQIAQQYCNQMINVADFSVALNIAIAFSGTFVAVEPGTKPAKPLAIINIIDAKLPALNAFRNLLVFGENSSAEVMVYNTDCSGVPTLTDSVSETVVGKNASLNVVHFTEAGDLSKMIFSDHHKLCENSTLTHTNIILDGGFVRRNTEALLAEKRCVGNLYGLVIANGSQHIDNHTNIDHAAPESGSTELYKGIVGNKAANIFNGRILVRKDSQKTEAYQSNKNILLHADAKAYTKPQLEIYADDVKCSHGATVGQLNEDALFYLRARGIAKHNAQKLILSGFAGETLAKINNPGFHEFLTSKIENKLLKI